MYILRNKRDVKRKGKVIPVTGCGGSQGCETSRLPHFLHNRLIEDGQVICLTHQPLFTSGRFLIIISVTDFVDLRAIVRLEGLDKSNR
jgi:hypothetical protein